MVNAIPIVEAVKELHKGYGLSKREKLRKVINMKEELLEFINSELDELRKKESRVPDTIDDDTCFDREDYYNDGHDDGRYCVYMVIKAMLESEK